MSTLFSDNFNTGTEPSTTNWTEDNGTWALSSSQLNSSGSGATFNYITTKTAAHALVDDCKVSITRRVDASFDAGPAVRISGSGTNPTCYYWDIVDGTNDAQVYCRASGSDRAIGSPITLVSVPTAV